MTAGKLGESQNHSNWPMVCQSNRGNRNGETTAMCSCLVVNVILSHHSLDSLCHSFPYHFSDFSFLSSNHHPLSPFSHFSKNVYRFPRIYWLFLPIFHLCSILSVSTDCFNFGHWFKTSNSLAILYHSKKKFWINQDRILSSISNNQTVNNEHFEREFI